MTAKYDLTINKGSNFEFWLQYQREDNTPVDMSGYTAKMVVKRFKGQEYPILFMSTTGLTYGYSSGNTLGITGTGNISLNTNYNGSGITGGISINIGANTTKQLSSGSHFYDLNLMIGVTYSQKLLEGKIFIQDGSS
jgi:hypothetical protein